MDWPLSPSVWLGAPSNATSEPKTVGTAPASSNGEEQAPPPPCDDSAEVVSSPLPIQVTPPAHMNDPDVGSYASTRLPQQHFRQPPDPDQGIGAGIDTSLDWSIGFKPIAINEASTPHATIAGLLRTLNANFTDLLDGQQEMCTLMKYLCQSQASREATLDAFSDRSHSKPKPPNPEREKLLALWDSRSPVKAKAKASPSPKAASAQATNNLPIHLEAGEDGVLSTGRSAFNSLRTKDGDLKELCDVITLAEEVQAPGRKRKWCTQTNISEKELELLVDGSVGVAVVANALLIAYSYDAPESQAYNIFLADFFFTTIFLTELGLKVTQKGLRGHFLGEAAKMNIFDAFLIAVDTAQLILSQLLITIRTVGGSTLEFSSLSLFRVLRLVRLARILRLLRYHIFDEMITMVGGMAGGLTTLFWAMVLYGFTVFVVSLMFREALGQREEVEDVYEYFSDVPRAMFTVFRCSFGDCDAREGKPIFEQVVVSYGPVHSFLYFVFMFVMTIGLFNVISAMFIEATVAAAATMRQHQKKARLQNEELFATRVFTILRKLAEWHQIGARQGRSLTEVSEHLYALDVPASDLRGIAKDVEVKQALHDLEIEEDDHDHLSVILDPDQNGCITVIELIEGLKHLRGEPKRSDIVQLNLMIRSVLCVVKEIRAVVLPSRSPAASPTRR
eukprot:TRINITY_DN824_c0_g5_i1.p1 TRINITY_DN824_c0_g5~~TRINITY_DN824_c0_g5_i1.p1  ORF type:complete len:676 (-),score=116.54 TRINITY_DN824_c0_g5_i1:402-2429(-)